MTFQEKLVAQVKAMGQEVIDRAEDLVGCGELMTEFDIWLHFPQSSGLPTLEVTREHLPRTILDGLGNREDED